MSSTDDEIRSGWMTPRDAELFRVLARGLTDDERRKTADAVARVDTQTDQDLRSSRQSDPAAEHGPEPTTDAPRP